MAEPDTMSPLAEVDAAICSIHTARSVLDAYGMPSWFCVEDRQAWPCVTEKALAAAVGRSERGHRVTPPGEEPF